VRFHVSDVFLPTPEEVSSLLTAETELEGTIVSFSDSGQRPNYFAVVDVIRRQSVVVAVNKLGVVTEDEHESEE